MAYEAHHVLLSTWHIISLSWFYYPVISFIFVSFSIWIASQYAISGVADAKNALVAACSAAEISAVVVANLPRYIAQTTTAETNLAISNSLESSHAALNDLITVAENIVGFIVQSIRNNLLCWFQFVFQGALTTLIQFVGDAVQFLQSTMGAVADVVQGAIDLTTSVANGVIDLINAGISVIDFFGATVAYIQHVSIGFNVSSIRDFTIPDTLESDLVALNNSLPTLDQLQNDVTALLNTPLETIRSEMNSTFADIGTPNVSVALPGVETIEFCSGLDTGFVDEIADDLIRVTHIGIGVIAAIVLIIIFTNGCCVRRIRNRRVDRIQAHATVITSTPKDVFKQDDDAGVQNPKAGVGAMHLTPEALLILDSELHHTFAHKTLDLVRSKFHLSPVAHDRLAWFFIYIFGPYSLIFFLIGLFGVLAIVIQLIAVTTVEQKVHGHASNVLQLVSTSIQSNISAALGPGSSDYATAMNTQLASLDNSINNSLFGWIYNATSALNSTIAALYRDLQSEVTHAFNGSFLEGPISDLLQCVLGTQVDALEGAADFLQSHIGIPIPRLPPDVLLLSNQTLDGVTSPIVDAAVGGGNGGIIGGLVDQYREELLDMLLMFGAIFGVWGVVILMGLAIILWDVLNSETPMEMERESQPPIRHGKEETEATAVDIVQHPSWHRRDSTDITLFPGSGTEVLDEEEGWATEDSHGEDAIRETDNL